MTLPLQTYCIRALAWVSKPSILIISLPPAENKRTLCRLSFAFPNGGNASALAAFLHPEPAGGYGVGLAERSSLTGGYLARDGEDLIVLFGGGTKRRQQRDINRANELLVEYKARKAQLKQEKPGGQGRRKKR